MLSADKKIDVQSLKNQSILLEDKEIAAAYSGERIAYSDYFGVQLDPENFGKSRIKHYQICNELLLKRVRKFEADGSQFCDFMSNIDLITFITKNVKKNKHTLSPYFVWEHCSSSTAQGRVGVMRLVPKSQHTPGSEYWRAIHRDYKYSGGYYEWAIPAGAPTKSNVRGTGRISIAKIQQLTPDKLPLYFHKVVQTNHYEHFQHLLIQAKRVCSPGQLKTLFTQNFSGGGNKPTTLLQRAVKNAYPPMVDAVLKCIPKEHLEDHLRASDKKGNSLIHIAAQHNRPLIVTQLSRLGVSLIAKNSQGQTVKDIAIERKFSACLAIYQAIHSEDASEEIGPVFDCSAINVVQAVRKYALDFDRIVAMKSKEVSAGASHELSGSVGAAFAHSAVSQEQGRDQQEEPPKQKEHPVLASKGHASDPFTYSAPFSNRQRPATASPIVPRISASSAVLFVIAQTKNISSTARITASQQQPSAGKPIIHSASALIQPRILPQPTITARNTIADTPQKIEQRIIQPLSPAVIPPKNVVQQVVVQQIQRRSPEAVQQASQRTAQSAIQHPENNRPSSAPPQTHFTFWDEKRKQMAARQQMTGRPETSSSAMPRVTAVAQAVAAQHKEPLFFPRQIIQSRMPQQVPQMISPRMPQQIMRPQMPQRIIPQIIPQRIPQQMLAPRAPQRAVQRAPVQMPPRNFPQQVIVQRGQQAAQQNVQQASRNAQQAQAAQQRASQQAAQQAAQRAAQQAAQRAAQQAAQRAAQQAAQRAAQQAAAQRAAQQAAQARAAQQAAQQAAQRAAQQAAQRAAQQAAAQRAAQQAAQARAAQQAAAQRAAQQAAQARAAQQAAVQRAAQQAAQRSYRR